MLLLTHYGDMPEAQQIYNKLQELKQVALTERKSFPFQRLLVFPEMPSDLPDDIYTFAYTDGPPIAVVIPGIRAAASPKFFPMRSSSQLLKKQQQQQVATPTKEIKPEHGASDLTAPSPGASDLNLPSPGDPVEIALYNSYKAALWKHRAAKNGVLLTPPSNAPACITAQLDGSCAGGSIKHEADGSLTLTSRLSHLPDLDVKGEVIKLEGELKGEPAVPTREEGDSDGLDEYQHAAIAALGKRQLNKKGDSDAKRQKLIGGGVKKRPAGKRGRPVGSGVKKPPSDVKKPPSGVKKPEPVSLSRKEALQAVPKLAKASTVNPPPIHYGGGVIYTDAKGQKFRCLKTAGDRYSEKCCSFKTKDKDVAWKECIQAIDDKNSKKVKKDKAGKSK